MSQAEQTNKDVKIPVAAAGVPAYTKDDFVSSQEVRWCPGCGDYAILATTQRTLGKMTVAKEKFVFVSGIGCSSRFPYYMNTYGFHTIHGRAPTIATGIKCARPDLSVWVITGDGDGLSIGGNHLLHCMRRNIDVNILLVNNQIYGLTKGQYSPTSSFGKVTKSTPLGSIDYPINALCVAIASEATFIARTLDTDPMHMSYVLERAMNHKGVSFVEIYQNCIIFNDKTFGPITGRETKEDRMVLMQHGKPLVFGKNRDKTVRLKGLQPEVVPYDPAKPDPSLIIHNEKDPLPHYAYLLTQMTYPEMPVPFGVFRAIEKPTYEQLMSAQVEQQVKDRGKGDLKKLIYGSETWTVK